LTSESKFVRDTAVAADPARPGWYRAELADDWNAPIVPQGGIVTVLAARAMQAELGIAEQPLRSVSCVFAGQVRSGPIDIEVTVIRRGRSISQLTATARNPGEQAGNTALAVFGAARPGFSFTELVMPDAPAPEDCPSYRDPLPEDQPPSLYPFSYWNNVEGRPVSGHPPWETYEPTTSECVNWYHFDEAPRLQSGDLDPLALVTLCDTMPGAVYERIGAGVDRPAIMSPSADLTVQVFGDWSSEWLLARNRARHAGDGYASLEMELWDPTRGIVAYATQLMFFSFPEGPPTPEHLRVPGANP
jgi:acyl-CoA thioesterase